MTDERNKNSEEYIIETAESILNEIVKPKYSMRRQYEYYYGIRNAEQYRYLEENFGVGNPTSVGFTPLIKNHVDYLAGQYVSSEPQAKVVCKDKNTIRLIENEKNDAINQARTKYYMDVLNHMIENQIKGEPIENLYNSKDIEKIDDMTSSKFVSSFEIAGQKIIEYVKQSKNIGLKNKRLAMFMDLLIAGMNFFRVSKTRSGDNIRLDVFNPMNVFFDKTPDSQYVKDCRRIVIRRWMTKYQIIQEYGEYLTRNDIDDIDEKFSHYEVRLDDYIYSMPGMPAPVISGLDDSDHETVPGYPYDYYHIGDDQFIPVYEIEWLDYDKNDGKDERIPKEDYEFVTYRYRCIRIGADQYLPLGKDEVYDRTEDNPSECKLTVSGVFMLDRTDRPFSMVRSCMHLQDKYDVICFMRDSVIAQSGAIGSWLDVSQLPQFLGEDMVERLQKWIGYNKTGLKLIDSSQDGNAANTVYQSYNETVQTQFIDAIAVALKTVESDMSKITGVYPSILGEGAEYQVKTQQEEIKSVLYITKRFFSVMDLAIEELLIDSINVAKVAWPRGKHGSLIFGDKVEDFNIIPKSYTATDYDLFIHSTSESIAESEKMTGLLQTLMQSQALDLSFLPDLVTSKSLTEMGQKIKESIAKKINYEEQISQLGQQLKNASETIQKQNQTIDELNKQRENYNIEKIKAERQKADEEIKFKYYESRQKLELEKQKLEFNKKKEGIK